MAAEFYATFPEAGWIHNHQSKVKKRLESLPTFVRRTGDEYWFRGTEKVEGPDRWPYDVRIFLLTDDRILLEISLHPPSIESDLKSFLAGLRRHTRVDVLDEDGEESTW